MSDRPTLANIEWDEQGQPLSAAFADVYFSRHNGLAETRHVFIQHNHLAARFAALAPGAHFSIAETGFGTGLNFLAAWQMWQETAPANTRLHFISCEKFPLTRGDLERALSLWPELATLSQALIDAYPEHLGPGIQRLHFGAVSLTLIIDDAAAGLAQLLPCRDERYQETSAKIDAWFLDGFAPSKNPDMWSEALFKTIGDLSHADTTAATFSAAGVVKRGLQAAGFSIAKVAGFGRKREMIRARREPPPTPIEHSRRPFELFQCATQPPDLKQAMVIGAGLAGCHIARALAERGWQVAVLDTHTQPASGGSGNAQGVLYSKLSHKNDTLPRFNLSALLYAQRHYQPFWQQGAGIGEACGVLQLAYSAKTGQQYRAIADPWQQEPWLEWLDEKQASAAAGVQLEHGGLFFPHSGWLNPPAVCGELLNHPQIDYLGGQAVATCDRINGQWQARDSEGELINQAPTAVIACAHYSRGFATLEHLPLKAIRGQVNYLPQTGASGELKTVLCAKGYLAPASDGQHSLGATFNLGETDLTLTPADQSKNLEHLQDFSGALAQAFAPFSDRDLPGRAAFRCTTPDYLPIVGPAPDAQAFARELAPLGKNARAYLDKSAPYHPGLYVMTGFGSRGLAYTPLCAEFLASLMAREPWPLDRELSKALHPARFLLRQMIRG
ncbi:bifunctional tRNA (5-methylaminomethyl-2-thiouridine)(34)-methyltransferase MnmD/FAD-dependent 5-carboxymethylaminomethyl-2-thiouridine(34) oxidoreductase MnmC [Gilvimarinus xylanilyticus]|uniref:tRNA 5-methylaminomethyl-2-thiouridine biosynthesis bifunctional protein MnmC n=1 Tax=Gilvimarinus xylanilyticus TaxID=2944139 RepID=A0A9X2HVG8_9GAMM|nr:bifunctional tRNA (5-methylaminomethyl-2-thiouridine)(34)-methyltransferase MnmD/FAD-dependent 5-carboxymethylaminomethyl-2-thiouridine(34) oxidoreductase MnmC [Gilvimarinus xylanilyticus]